MGAGLEENLCGGGQGPCPRMPVVQASTVSGTFLRIGSPVGSFSECKRSRPKDDFQPTTCRAVPFLPTLGVAARLARSLRSKMSIRNAGTQSLSTSAQGTFRVGEILRVDPISLRGILIDLARRNLLGGASRLGLAVSPGVLRGADVVQFWSPY